MSHRYFPHTQQDVDEMLEACGVESTQGLFADIPAGLLLDRGYDIPQEKSEAEVREYFNELFAKNKHYKAVLAGGGFYSHHLPSAIPSLLSRSEFLTAYTPYQPEISQGTLQYIFEYQTLMARLTGMEISNASLYDGATATAEAMMLAVAHVRKKNRVLVSEGLNPQTMRVVSTYAKYRNITVTTLPLTASGTTSRERLDEELAKGDVAGVIVATPNYYGIVEDYTGWAETCHQAKALFIVNAIAADLVSLKSPGEWGADIAVGDAQSLGIPLNYGGPYLGYICGSKALMRKLPGRIVGMTKDSEGRRSFVLTLQAREQHIRREKATSNICSNQGLMALHVTMYMALLGLNGLREINQIGYDGAHWLASQLEATGKARLAFPQSPFFNEFLLKFNSTDTLYTFVEQSKEQGIFPGIRVSSDCLLIAVTETVHKKHLDEIVKTLQLLD